MRPRLARLPRRASWTMAAVLLSAGAPAGLLLVRLASGGRPSAEWLRTELAGDPILYGYVSLSTAIAFGLFGYALGRQADGLARASTTDALTGLHNARAFHDRLAEETARAARYGEPLALLLLDVDSLKSVNDRDGHRAGDRALQRVAAAIRESLRASDFAARWGGDEFVVLAPGTLPEPARVLGDRIRSRVAEGAPGGPALTVSIGVAALGRGGAVDSGALIDAADVALYRAKAAGRNRVTAF